MGSELVASFFALLLLGGAGGLVIGVLRSSTRQAIAEQALGLSAVVAVGATLGSLYFSEVAGFVPCELCWYQRIAMYPLAVLLSLAVASKDSTIQRYVLFVASIGLAIAAYHVQLQLFPDQGSFCELANPCTASPTKAFGWITIPQMSLVSFALVAALSALSIFTPTQETP